MLIGHGGNVDEIRRIYGISELLDFSTNVNPLGYPPGLKEFLFKNFDSIKSYPDIKNETLRAKLSSPFGKQAENIMLGNGSTELLYLIPRVLAPTRGFVFSPSYSDYRDSLTYASVPVEEIPPLKEKHFLPDFEALSPLLRGGDIVFLGNPNNPTSNTVSRDSLFWIIEKHPETVFVIDESFNGFLRDWKEKSLLFGLQNLGFPDNLLVVQSLTKLYTIPGIRLGMLAASESMVRKLETFMQPWTVNSLALMAADFITDQEEYLTKTRDFVFKEKEYLYSCISRINGVRPFYPESNFLIVKIEKNDISLKEVLLKKYQIYVRSCSNFPSLSSRYFRIAVLDREKNNCLITALQKIFD